ncbi:MAG: hypothetical protein MUE82_08855 [Chloroflexi bacterium]|nr:hypothetical protein [Chloroflexota bacterium]
MADPIAVLVEVTPKRSFASALEWPGWSRSGRDEAAAVAALDAYAGRYGRVAAAAGHPLPVPLAAIEVVEQAEGNATTAFGAPDVRAALDARPLGAAEAARLAALVEATWAALDRIAAGAPAELRKGPRGGGRDRDAVLAHVLAAENAYARTIGIKVPEPAVGDAAAIAAQRLAIAALLAEPSDGSPLDGRKWPPRYAARRIAWHVLDHGWEIEDRSEG